MDNNLESKNEYFAKKEEKDKIIQEERRKKMIRRVSGWLAVLAVLGLLVLYAYSYFQKEEVSQKTTDVEYFRSQGRDHIKTGDSHPPYNSNPPTSGWHYDVPNQSGIYDKSFTDEQLVHNLEHGHVWIAYKPDLPADEIEKLANLAKSYGSKIIMTSREANDVPIVFVAWEYLLKMQTLDESQARAFINAYRGKGPETIPDFGFKDFRSGK
ncbi:MAG: DUF3105 domain-containing protein [Candidatus Yanofskybacteria bacterium]|nr:DUF3105 domain-containing protein [Candidatus Yanofskybacteria bacterium]